MTKAMVKCNEVPTQVIAYGRWIEEGLATEGDKRVVVIFPGNPGVPEFYEEFAKTIKQNLLPETAVWIVGYAGHTQPPENLAYSMPDIKSHKNLFDLKGQLEHKAEFIKKYVPEDAKLHLIGHSIGSWLVVNLMRDEEIAKRVEKCYLLFPTVEYMKDSPSGKFLEKVVFPLSWLLVFLSWIFSFFPVFLQFLCIQIFGLFYGIPKTSIKAVLSMINPESLKRIFFLARHELLIVKEADHDVISEHERKFFMYYSERDGWTPMSYYANMKNRHPNAQIELCKYKIQHTFVLKESKKMGEIVGEAINRHS